MKLYTEVINDETKECLIMNQIEAKNKGLQEMEVDFGYDGKYYLSGYAPQKPLDEAKQEKLQQLKSNCSNYIYTKYPIYKQLNVANGLATEEEITEMTTFVNKTRLICNDKEEQVNKAESLEDLDKIDISNFVAEDVGEISFTTNL